MTILDTFLVYSGAVTLASIFMYGLRDYWVTLVGGFIAFCLFYFSFGVKNFEWEVFPILLLLKDAAIIYLISFVIVVIIYKIIPLKPKQQTIAQ